MVQNSIVSKHPTINGRGEILSHLQKKELSWGKDEVFRSYLLVRREKEPFQEKEGVHEVPPLSLPWGEKVCFISQNRLEVPLVREKGPRDAYGGKTECQYSEINCQEVYHRATARSIFKGEENFPRDARGEGA